MLKFASPTCRMMSEIVSQGCQCNILCTQSSWGNLARQFPMFRRNIRPMFPWQAFTLPFTCWFHMLIRAKNLFRKYHLEFQPRTWTHDEGTYLYSFCTSTLGISLAQVHNMPVVTLSLCLTEIFRLKTIRVFAKKPRQRGSPVFCQHREQTLLQLEGISSVGTSSFYNCNILDAKFAGVNSSAINPHSSADFLNFNVPIATINPSKVQGSSVKPIGCIAIVRLCVGATFEFGKWNILRVALFRSCFLWFDGVKRSFWWAHFLVLKDVFERHQVCWKASAFEQPLPSS